MATFQLTELIKLLKRLVPSKFCFIFPLKTGIQFYCLTSFITGVLITDVLLTRMIDQQPTGCRGYQSVADLVRCPDIRKPLLKLERKNTQDLKTITKQIQLETTGMQELKTLVTKQILLLHTSLSMMSALLLYFLKWPTLPLYWSGGKAVVTTTGLCYLPEWSRDILFEFFNFNIHSTWITVFLIVVDLYGVLVALGYHSELVSSETTSPPPDVSIDMPDPPNIDMALGPL